MPILTNHKKEERPWGDFEQFTFNELATTKRISVAPGQAFSLQYHKHRDEFWRVERGSGIVHLDGKEYAAELDDRFMVYRGMVHRITGGPQGITVFETSFGEFDENDIVRLEDRYGRT